MNLRAVRLTGALVVGAMCVALAACGGQADRTTAAPATGQPPGAAAAANTAPAKLNIDEIFPPGEGRELVLNNCTSCHTIVPIVVLQMTKDAWELNAREHRDRVTSLSDAEVATLYAYLAANFNPGRPVPKLPKELLDTWTAYE
jgi:mono/diheme cytochrome c family protein